MDSYQQQLMAEMLVELRGIRKELAALRCKDAAAIDALRARVLAHDFKDSDGEPTTYGTPDASAIREQGE